MILTIHTDGGSRGNPGPAAIGVVISDEEKEIYTISERVGVQTNNFAEYSAVLAALEHLHTLPSPSPEKVLFFLDSLLVVSQINGVFSVKNPQMKVFFEKVRVLLKSLPFSVTFSYVPREQNRRADELVNNALDSSI